MANRWQIYQRERFPLLAYAPLTAAFSFAAVSFSSLLRGQAAPLGTPSLLTAWISVFLFFLELRIADEFKDQKDDARFRPYRPVPRGLVTLRELGRLGGAAALIQLGLALWMKPPLAMLLILVWLYLGLMGMEFFVREWLKAHPITYLWTHMLIMPLIALYATACEWMVAATTPAAGLRWFLVTSFFNGIVIEIGRKIRAPEEEEHGVETYSTLLGPRNAVLAWLGAMLLAGMAALLAADRIGVAAPVAGLLGILFTSAMVSAWLFLRQLQTKWARILEPMSGLWTFLTYLALGALPLLQGT